MGAGMKGGTGAALAARASPPHAACGPPRPPAYQSGLQASVQHLTTLALCLLHVCLLLLHMQRVRRGRWLYALASYHQEVTNRRTWTLTCRSLGAGRARAARTMAAVRTASGRTASARAPASMGTAAAGSASGGTAARATAATGETAAATATGTASGGSPSATGRTAGGAAAATAGARPSATTGPPGARAPT